jgi:hypothetical protein
MEIRSLSFIFWNYFFLESGRTNESRIKIRPQSSSCCAAKNNTANEYIVKIILRVKQVVDDACEVLERFLKACSVKKRKNPD